MGANNDYNSPSFKKLLDSLQQQSWELELIISGFAIFGLFTAYEPLRIETVNAENQQQIYRFVVYLILQISCSILLFNLLLHVILRGLWIGSLGLRYVSGDIEFEKLRYSERFTKYLQKRIVSFDRYIANLENYCSVLFAISFLLIFYVLAMTMIILSIVLVANFVIESDYLPEGLSSILGVVLIIFIITGMTLTFIDFLTQGWLKRKKWISRIYFPIYWVFSFLTLSFLYRPLVYNFLDNRFGRRLILLLVPIYIAILMITSLEYRNSNYLEKDEQSSSTFANKENYADMLVEDGDFPGQVVIPSKVINKPFLKVFVPFSENLENRIFAYNDSLRPENDRRGLSSSMKITTNWSDQITSARQKDSIRKMYLRTFNETHAFRIDSLDMDEDFILTTGINNILGFETYLKISNLNEGKHLLRLRRKRKEKDTVVTVTDVILPFWYFKD
ncbi:MAG TPA: hypothetical protein DEF18_07930 [Muricauda sp.]|uniref:Uncharacterized protein n=1 Tax=Flagellimonas aurea TaxID=2915619 RepID=A0ABS3G8C5_9FLAO|nr:hypothetical protein [Allomuricauda aurea]MAO15741.1 hypothetical protein [Allomuricauda sp.]MBC73200.1 hypothetical protein [Allomuricauda sp.]MBO0354822.1 hypothetical protein [Allomuricauda aurea]HBU78017.1 hypothetical protein [Allomuricauda sp.]